MKANIIGCGLAGVTAAILLKEKGYDVEIFESRSHIGGNCYDQKIKGITVHKYGPHGFHTNNDQVWSFLNRYTKFNNVCLRVKANTKEGIIPLPFNRESEKIIGKKSPEEIIDLIFKDYSEKMWGVPWENLPKSITSRVPKLRDDNSHCFQNMLNGIKVNLGVNKDEWRRRRCDLLIYTGKIDEYFNYCYGWLEYRSLSIQFETAPKRKDIFQLNECNKKKFTRSIDHSHWHEQDVKDTIISKEYPQEHDESNTPFYPKPFGENISRYKRYKDLANREKNTIFIGRLATYKYLDMDDVIAQTLTKLKKI